MAIHGAIKVGSQAPPPWELELGLGVMLVVCALATRLFMRHQIRDGLKSNKPIRCEVDETGWLRESDGVTLKFGWDKLKEVRELKDGFLLVFDPRGRAFQIKRAFKSDADIQRFRELVATKSRRRNHCVEGPRPTSSAPAPSSCAGPCQDSRPWEFPGVWGLPQRGVRGSSPVGFRGPLVAGSPGAPQPGPWTPSGVRTPASRRRTTPCGVRTPQD